MHWIYILLLVVVFVAFFAIPGAEPEKGRPASKTRLMTAARIMLVVVALLLVLAYFQAT